MPGPGAIFAIEAPGSRAIEIATPEQKVGTASHWPNRFAVTDS